MTLTASNQFTNLPDEEKDRIVNAGTGRRLTAEESAWKTRDWPRFTEIEGESQEDRTKRLFGSPQPLVGNNIPCGYDSEGNPSNDCYCEKHE